MRVALLATHHAEYAANLALALAGDHEVLLVLSARNAGRQLVPESFDLLRKSLQLAIVPHHYAPLQPWIAWRCARLVRAFRPDVVHAQEHPSRSPALAQRLLGGRWPFVTTVHDPKPHSGADAGAAAVFERYYAKLRARSDALIVHGARMVEQLAGLLPDGAARVHSVPHGVLRFGRLEARETAAPADGPLIFFGRMNRYKGLDLLLDANDIWRAGGNPPKLIVAGTGPELGRLAARLEEAPNIERHCRRVSQDELSALLARASAAILPYRDATQSGAAATCFGAGRPVITTSVGSLPEVIEDGVNGLLLPPDDAHLLADAGRRFLEDAPLRARLGQGARDTANGALGWRDIARRTVEVYRAASGRR